MDEFHYASTDRPPGAQQVLESLDLDCEKKDTSDDIIAVVPEDHPVPQLPLDTLDPILSERSRHSNHTAHAAVCLQHQSEDDATVDDTEIPALIPGRTLEQEESTTLLAVHTATCYYRTTGRAPRRNHCPSSIDIDDAYAT